MFTFGGLIMKITDFVHTLAKIPFVMCNHLRWWIFYVRQYSRPSSNSSTSTANLSSTNINHSSENRVHSVQIWSTNCFFHPSCQTSKRTSRLTSRKNNPSRNYFTTTLCWNFISSVDFSILEFNSPMLFWFDFLLCKYNYLKE